MRSIGHKSWSKAWQSFFLGQSFCVNFLIAIFAIQVLHCHVFSGTSCPESWSGPQVGSWWHFLRQRWFLLLYWNKKDRIRGNIVLKAGGQKKLSPDSNAFACQQSCGPVSNCSFLVRTLAFLSLLFSQKPPRYTEDLWSFALGNGLVFEMFAELQCFCTLQVVVMVFPMTWVLIQWRHQIRWPVWAFVSQQQRRKWGRQAQ